MRLIETEARAVAGDDLVGIFDAPPREVICEMTPPIGSPGTECAMMKFAVIAVSTTTKNSATRLKK